MFKVYGLEYSIKSTGSVTGTVDPTCYKQLTYLL